MSLTIRKAEPQDVVTILEFIYALAVYEKMEAQVKITEEQLALALFEERTAEVLIAEWSGQAIGFALFFHNFSTFTGKKGIYLEDLFIYPEFRGRGIGTSLLAYLAALAQKRVCGRFEWSCLDWNSDSLEFYKRLGAEQKNEWILHRLTGDKLAALAEKGAELLVDEA